MVNCTVLNDPGKPGANPMTQAIGRLHDLHDLRLRATEAPTSTSQIQPAPKVVFTFLGQVLC